MSDTPQNEEVTNEVVSAEIEINDSVTESETVEAVQPESNEPVDEEAIAKTKANEAFNKQYGEKKQLERDLAEQREVNARYEQETRDRATANLSAIPEVPSEFDDDFDEKMKIRDNALIAHANHQHQQNAYAERVNFDQQQQAQATLVKTQESVDTYSKKAEELGISKAELRAAAGKVEAYGLSNDLVMHILDDTDGPLITKHLAENPEDGYKLASMSPYVVGNFLSEIKAKASALKPKTSKAPSPVDDLRGVTSDFDAKRYAHLEGSSIDVGSAW